MRTHPDQISEENIGGKVIRRDEGGYLTDPEDWSRAVAERIAAEEGIALGDEHWAVIAFMRAYLEEHGISADARFVFRDLGERHGEPAKAARQRFFELFPYGYTKQACKIAGMRQPRAWSTG
jgi:TusE/DsrC/DsvC family sulfur relay protein